MPGISKYAGMRGIASIVYDKNLSVRRRINRLLVEFNDIEIVLEDFH